MRCKFFRFVYLCFSISLIFDNPVFSYCLWRRIYMLWVLLDVSMPVRIAVAGRSDDLGMLLREFYPELRDWSMELGLAEDGGWAHRAMLRDELLDWDTMLFDLPVRYTRSLRNDILKHPLTTILNNSDALHSVAVCDAYKAILSLLPLA